MLKFWQTSLGITRLETFDNDKLLEVTVQTTSTQVRGTGGDCRVVGTHCWTPRHRAPSIDLVRFLSSGPGPQEEKGSQGCLLRGWSRQVSPQHASWPRLGLIWGTRFCLEISLQVALLGQPQTLSPVRNFLQPKHMLPVSSTVNQTRFVHEEILFMYFLMPLLPIQ